jgi:hypothetical protein
MKEGAYQWAGAFFSAAHKDPRNGKLHGHTWRVRAYWPHAGGDILDRQKLLRRWVASLDHRELPAHLHLAEDIAAHLGHGVQAVRVEVWREAEDVGATWVA